MYCKTLFSTFSQPHSAELHQNFIPEKSITHILVDESKNIFNSWWKLTAKSWLFYKQLHIWGKSYASAEVQNYKKNSTLKIVKNPDLVNFFGATKKLTKSGFHCIYQFLDNLFDSILNVTLKIWQFPILEMGSLGRITMWQIAKLAY